jgi:hypothetical protein
MTDEQKPDPATSFKAHGKTVCIWSEKFGVEIWLVPELTGKDRIEFTADEMHKFGLCLDTFGGEILELTSKDGRVFKVVPGWEERARRRKLLDDQIHYDILLDREKDLRRRIDDPATPKAERERLTEKWEREVEELNRLIETIREAGHAMTDDEIRDGFEATLRRKLAGDDRSTAASSPSRPGAALSTGEGALTVERARDLLRRER